LNPPKEKTWLTGEIAKMVAISISDLETQKAALCGVALNDRTIGSVNFFPGTCNHRDLRCWA